MADFPGGLPDLSGLLSQLQQFQQQVTEAQEQLGAEEVEGSAGGGAVRIRVSGELSFTSVQIDPRVIAAGEVQVVEDLVLAALRDASAKLQSARQTALGSAMGDVLGALFEDDDEEDDEEDDEADDEDEDEDDGDERHGDGPAALSGPDPTRRP